MIKKAILFGGGGLLLLGILAGTGVWSYVQTSAGYVSDAVHDAVPVEFEVKRARTMIADLQRPIKSNRTRIAWEEVKVKRLEKQIADARAELAEDKDQMMRLKGDLASARDAYEYAGRTYTAEQVRTDLANRFERYKTAEATLETLEKIHQARLKGLDAAVQKLAAMEATKRQLEVEVENLDARRQMIAAAQTTSEFQFDDSHLGRVKELIADLGARLDVADKMLAAETDFHAEIPLDEPAEENIVEQVSHYFAKPTEKPTRLAATE